MPIKLKGLGIGRRDFTRDTFIANVPLVIRHQSRISYNMKANINTTVSKRGWIHIIPLMPVPVDMLEDKYTIYTYTFNISLADYYYVELWYGLLDFDMVIYLLYGLILYDGKEDLMETIFHKLYGKSTGKGSVNVVLDIPIQMSASEEEYRAKSYFLPEYYKYFPGVVIVVNDNPGKVIDTTMWYHMSGMLDKYAETTK